MRTVVIVCIFLGAVLNLTNLQAQAWIPEGVQETTILIERFNYQDPVETLEDVSDEYVDDKEEFFKNENTQLEANNAKLDEIFKAYQAKYVTVSPSKIKEEFPDRNTHRYILRREAFFGNKNVYNVETKKSENQSYFAYRYYFYDRVTRETYPSYYFSGDKWAQLKRLTFWLNQAKG